MTNNINSLTNPNQATNNTNSSLFSTGSANLGKDSFLKLLVTQLKNQDPMNPMDDRDFIAQMATFSQLEQLMNMNSTLSTYLNFQTGQGLIQYSDLIGKDVEYVKVIKGEDGSITTENKSGVVKAIQYKNSTVMLELKDGSLVDPSYVQVVGEPTQPTQPE